MLFRATGGKDAEKDERLKWDTAERKRIMDSVNGIVVFKRMNNETKLKLF